MNTDKDWARWGRSDPYYGVLRHEKYRRAQLTDEVLQEFFRSGADEVEYLLDVVRRRIDSTFKPRTVLDFGCGPGRLLPAFAAVCESVLGLDVSDGMLQEAARNCEMRGAQNVALLRSDDDLTGLTGSFDLIHSVIVFQHIPPSRGVRIFRHLLEHLAAGGVGIIQVNYADQYTYGPSLARYARRGRALLGMLLRRIVGLVRTRDPDMRMHAYSLNRLTWEMQRAGIHKFYAECTDHGGYYGAYLFFQKPRQP